MKNRPPKVIRKHNRTFICKTVLVTTVIVSCTCFFTGYHLLAQDNGDRHNGTSSELDKEKHLFTQLVEHPESEDFLTNVDELLHFYSDPYEQISVFKRLLRDIQEPTARHSLLRRLAELEEQLGLLQEAQRHYRAAAFCATDKKDFESLLKSATILYELGYYQKAESEVKTIVTAGNSDQLSISARVLSAKISLNRGDIDNAVEEAKEVISLYGQETFSATQLYNFYGLFQTAGMEREGEKIKARLQAQYPNSIEAFLIATGGEGVISEYPRPHLFFLQKRRNTEDSRNELLAVQTGSFIKKEHAEAMVSRLQEDGFEAQILEKRREEKTFFKVILPMENPDAVQDSLIKLKEKGYEAFLLFD